MDHKYTLPWQFSVGTFRLLDGGKVVMLWICIEMQVSRAYLPQTFLQQWLDIVCRNGVIILESFEPLKTNAVKNTLRLFNIVHE